MNRTKTMALFTGIFAIAMTTISLSDTSSTSMMTLPQTQDGVSMLGHVEYLVLDNNQQIKGYYQGDNLVVDDGTDCVAKLVFGATTTGTEDCDQEQAFNYIAIGNVTGTVAAGDEGLQGGACATNGAAGEMARKIVIPNITTQGAGSGTIIELEPATTFKFDSNNATTIHQSGIFNAQVSAVRTSEPGGGSCLTYGTEATDFDMFAKQNLASSVAVTDGDSLAVKWTITIS